MSNQKRRDPREAAEDEARRIREYWRRKGHEVRVWVGLPVPDGRKDLVFPIRTNLVNGMPRR